jgi:RsiW-degrading membrane proteinase PrsW (M82 family)
MFLYPIFIVLGLIPSTIWLLFYLRKDKRPEPNAMVIKIFIYGMAVTLPAALIEWKFVALLQGLNFSQNILLAIYFLAGVGLVEELAKYLVIRLSVLKNTEFDEPVDAMIYMIIVGLGFAALENILILFLLKEPYLIEKTALALSGRFIGATFLHALCSANVGFFLALSLFKTKKRRRLLFFGLLISIALHGLFNIAIKIEGWQGTTTIITILASLFIIVLFEFKKVKKLASVCRVRRVS